MSEKLTEKWTIFTGTYGSFQFEGTEEEAENMRAHKARWERAAGYKYRTDRSTDVDRLQGEVCDLYEQRKGAPEALVRKLRKARAALQEKRHG